MHTAVPTLQQEQFFRKMLLEWQKNNHRPLPWKGEKDPYLIWLSEIVLQQTRVEQGRPFFEKFKAAYPRIEALAAAPAEEVMKLWEGLGYYTRARHLHQTAQYIAVELQGSFPKEYEQIRNLKGVGDYTAAAIASFAYALPYAVVDGNVYRILSRFFGLEIPIDSTAGKKEYARIAQKLLDKEQPGSFNQAIMDLGATLCTPAKPDCKRCPLLRHCAANRTNLVVAFPVRSKNLVRRWRYFTYLLIQHNGGIYIHQRIKKDIWHLLFELPLIETEAPMNDIDTLQHQAEWVRWFEQASVRLKTLEGSRRHILTHQTIEARFAEVEVEDTFQAPAEEGWRWVSRSELRDFAFPKLIINYFEQNALPFER